MDRSWMYGRRDTIEFLQGVKEFCQCASKHQENTGGGEIYCPCVDCANVNKFSSIKVIRDHIICRGFRQQYHVWLWHGEMVNVGESGGGNVHQTPPVSDASISTSERDSSISPTDRDLSIPTRERGNETNIAKPVDKKGKGRGKSSCRGPTKGIKVKEPMHLEFDALGQPCGRWRFRYGQQVGLCMRKLSITWEWPNVDEGLKESMWQETRRLFHIPEDKELRGNFLSRVAERFRDFKGKLVSGWITFSRPRSEQCKKRTPDKVWKHISATDWAMFKKRKLDPDVMKKREKAVAAAKKNEHHHHMGSMSYEDSRKVWIKDGFYPAAAAVKSSTGSTPQVAIKVNRGDDWYCARHKKDKKTGARSIPKESTRAVADKYLEFRDKALKGEFVPERNKDALYMALGEKPDHLGRAYGFGGVKIGYKKAFGKPPPRTTQSTTSGSSTTPEEHAHMMAEMREEIEKKMQEELTIIIRQEFDAELEARVRQSLSSLLCGTGITGEHVPIPSIVIPPETQPPNQVGPSPSMKDGKECRFLWMDTESGVLSDVAGGYVLESTESDQSHNMDLLPGYMRVCVETVVEDFLTVQLPVPIPQFNIETLEEAKGTFVQWPANWVRFSVEATPNAKKLRKKEVKCKGSNNQSSEGAQAQKQLLTSHSLEDSLPKRCRTLHTMLGIYPPKHTIIVPLDGCCFHYDQEVAQIAVDKGDILEFLENKWLNIPIIQIFMRAIQDDMASSEPVTKVGWLCPDTTADTRVTRSPVLTCNYVCKAIKDSSIAGVNYILAPIIQENHWMLLVICPEDGIVYLFDSIRSEKMRDLDIGPFVTKALRGTGCMKRKVALWKPVECAQQVGGDKCGYFVMKYMYDIITTCLDAEDIAQFLQLKRVQPFTKEELDEVREKWAKYFIEYCI